jgi:hypothetical protein
LNHQQSKVFGNAINETDDWHQQFYQTLSVQCFDNGNNIRMTGEPDG